MLGATATAIASHSFQRLTALSLCLLAISCGAGAGAPRIWECVIADGGPPDYTHEVGCLDDFSALASRPLDSSIPGARSAKTIIDRADGDALYYTNSNTHPMHYAFAVEFLSGNGLPPLVDHAQFNQTAYFSPDRRFLLGAITRYEGPGVWTYELAPYDTASAAMVERAMKLIKRSAYFGEELTFHPTSASLESMAADLAGWVKVISTDALFAGIDYQPLNLGESYGQLRFFTAAELRTKYVGPRDVVVLDSVPNDISVVAGLITAQLQTPLSHVNVLSQNRGTPNMALRGAHEDPTLRALEDHWVRLEVGAFDYTLEEATREAADAWWEAHKPPPVGVPDLDLTVTDLRDVQELSPDDIPAFGGKASNYGVLARIGEAVPHRPGFAIPVYYYKQFEQMNGFDVQLAQLQADDAFNDDPAVREAALADLQAGMLMAPVDPAFEALVVAKLEAEFPATRMRFRSSTNAEDLAGFSGAGLYSSTSGQVGDPSRPVLDAIRFTWASLWNFRAYEERAYNGIPQDSVAMALLVHPSFPDEEANGVALTNNIFDETEPAFFVNVQVGEFSVVSPDPGITVDSFLYYYLHPGQPITYLSYSNLTPAGVTVLDEAQIHTLGRALQAIHAAFAPYYQIEGAFYAIDVEFKFDDLGSGGAPGLWIKQARPHDGWAGE